MPRHCARQTRATLASSRGLEVVQVLELIEYAILKSQILGWSNAESLHNEEFVLLALRSSSRVTEGRGVFCRCLSKLTQQLKD